MYVVCGVCMCVCQNTNHLPRFINVYNVSTVVKTYIECNTEMM